MIRWYRLLRRTPQALLVAQFMLATTFLVWLAVAGYLPLWAGPALFVTWMSRGRRDRPALRVALGELATNTDGENIKARRHIRLVAAVLAHRAGVEAPIILPKPSRIDHNLEVVVQENALLVTAPALWAVSERGLVGRPLAGVLAHEIAHLAQDRPWHHITGPLRGATVTAGLLGSIIALLGGLHPVFLILALVVVGLGFFNRLLSQSLELRADALAVKLTGDNQDLRMGMAILTVLDVMAFEPLPRHLAVRYAADLRALSTNLGDRVCVSGQTLDVMADRIMQEAGPSSGPSWHSRLGGLFLGDWPASHPSPAWRLALLTSSPEV